MEDTSVDVSNVLNEEKHHQVIALAQLRWPRMRIQEEAGVRRETAGVSLKAAGVAVRTPGGWGPRPASKPAIPTTPDCPPNPKPDYEPIQVSTDFGIGSSPGLPLTPWPGGLLEYSVAGESPAGKTEVRNYAGKKPR